MYLFYMVLRINGFIGANTLLGPLEGVSGPLKVLIFRAFKSPDFQGPPLPRALKMDLPTLKLLHPAPYKQQVNYRLS